ncbi:DNA polymerase alpha subunit B [Trypanosoma theileri]|uniref:DNA polymerase alpha subunit B n=1 Tax=Trypanosoma theileri TaxID=67003 RepID=A0A1X0NW10_9TRYP|nr:DNA polymerase alpha subunit B [Trypanosoma theileri]ORC88310.1 DNA polymerase alpha subunit B [Trypanosoma theileri]
MQPNNRWKPAANLDLLLGAEHPPARIIKKASAAFSSTDVDDEVVDARNTVSFSGTTYCNRQDNSYSTTRQRLMEYYRFMFSKIPLWDQASQLGVEKKEEAESSVVKSEVDTEDVNYSNGHTPSMLQYRALGILTQTNDPGAVGQDLQIPWEFYPIMDVDDEGAYIEAFKALTKEAAHTTGLLNVEVENDEDGTSAATTTAAAGGMGSSTGAALHSLSNTHSGGRLSLYTRLIPNFTGIYPGIPIGVVGEPFKRSSSGALTGILVRHFILPSRPEYPWHIERPLSLQSSHSSIPTRVHFCSGPFPRHEIRYILTAVTQCALLRGADLLIIAGPLVKGFEEFEKELMMTTQSTFDEMLTGYMDTIEETIERYYAEQNNVRVQHHLKVVLVSHRDDVTQIPVLPTIMYGLEDGADVWVRSNPCRITVNGIHFGVCNEDVVGDMRERMVERWGTETGSLRRVVESLVLSRLYAPIYELPAEKHEIRHLSTLRMDYMPNTSQGTDANGEEKPLSWNSLQSLIQEEEENTAGDVKRETKRVKGESTETSFPSHHYYSNASSVEYMPHIMFLPSTRPRFAMVTHRSVWDASVGIRRDESLLDDTSTATGVLVVNQEIWSRRSARKFELRVAEVTIPDSDCVMRRGASEANGVSCGLIYFANNTAA